MNKVMLIGRWTKEHRLGNAADGSMILSNSIAVAKSEGADFFDVVAYKDIASRIDKYTHKGSKVAISGKLSTGSYTGRDGVKRYTVNVIINEVEFLDSKNQDEAAVHEQPSVTEEGYIEVPKDTDEELPFK